MPQVTSRPVPADALDDRGVRGLDAVVLLADARQNKHVVVYGQPV